jgi:hypothetical protein
MNWLRLKLFGLFVLFVTFSTTWAVIAQAGLRDP